MFNKIDGKDGLVRKLDRLAWDKLEIHPFTEASPTVNHTYLGASLGLTNYGIRYRVSYVGWFGKRRNKVYTEQLGVGSFYSDEEQISRQMMDVMSNRFDAVHPSVSQRVTMYDADRKLIATTVS